MSEDRYVKPLPHSWQSNDHIPDRLARSSQLKPKHDDKPA